MFAFAVPMLTEAILLLIIQLLERLILIRFRTGQLNHLERLDVGTLLAPMPVYDTST
jgi:hypothetical protein